MWSGCKDFEDNNHSLPTSCSAATKSMGMRGGKEGKEEEEEEEEEEMVWSYCKGMTYGVSGV